MLAGGGGVCGCEAEAFDIVEESWRLGFAFESQRVQVLFSTLSDFFYFSRAYAQLLASNVSLCFVESDIIII